MRSNGVRSVLTNPKHAQISRNLIADLKRGKFAPGELLPTEAILQKRFNCSRHTIRVALRTLYERGLVISKQGKGTIVQNLPKQPLYQSTFSTLQSLVQYAKTTSRTVLTTNLVLLNEDLSHWLNCPQGYKWWKIRTKRQQKSDGAVIASSTIYVPRCFESAVSKLTKSTLPLFSIMQKEYPHEIARVEQTFSVTYATEEEALDLNVKQGTAVMAVERRFIDERGGLIEVARSAHQPEYFQYHMTLNQVTDPDNH
jgi:GntR family transcriptional regulator